MSFLITFVCTFDYYIFSYYYIEATSIDILKLI